MTPCWLLRRWLDLALSREIKKAEALCLCTVTREGFPTSRMLLAGAILDDGVTFYTDRRSPKVADVASKPNAAALFYWPTLSRQVRLEGVLEILPAALAEADFDAKSPDQQLAIVLSEQSAPLEHYWTLHQEFAARLRTQTDARLRRPPHWVGYCLRARRVEYLLGGKQRLNKRLALEKHEGAWTRHYLAP